MEVELHLTGLIKNNHMCWRSIIILSKQAYLFKMICSFVNASNVVSLIFPSPAQLYAFPSWI